MIDCKIRIVKRWHEQGARFLFYVQQFEDDASFDQDRWVDRCGPFDTHMEARHIVTEVILMGKSVYDTELVIEEF